LSFQEKEKEKQAKAKKKAKAQEKVKFDPRKLQAKIMKKKDEGEGSTKTTKEKESPSKNEGNTITKGKQNGQLGSKGAPKDDGKKKKAKVSPVKQDSLQSNDTGVASSIGSINSTTKTDPKVRKLNKQNSMDIMNTKNSTPVDSGMGSTDRLIEELEVGEADDKNVDAKDNSNKKPDSVNATNPSATNKPNATQHNNQPTVGSSSQPTVGSSSQPTVGSSSQPTVGSSNQPTVGSSTEHDNQIRTIAEIVPVTDDNNDVDVGVIVTNQNASNDLKDLEIAVGNENAMVSNLGTATSSNNVSAIESAVGNDLVTSAKDSRVEAAAKTGSDLEDVAKVADIESAEKDDLDNVAKAIDIEQGCSIPEAKVDMTRVEKAAVSELDTINGQSEPFQSMQTVVVTQPAPNRERLSFAQLADGLTQGSKKTMKKQKSKKSVS
jgi:hypothetical protein